MSGLVENGELMMVFRTIVEIFLRKVASVLSGTLVSAQDVTATWLMHDLGASSFSLSLLASAASAPFFLFTLPAGAIADIVNRRTVIVSVDVDRICPRPKLQCDQH